MTDSLNRETLELEAEYQRLDRLEPPTQWDRASWIRGSMFALAWVTHRRGAELSPLEASALVPVAPVPPARPDGTE